jgi:hypothetical protein
LVIVMHFRPTRRLSPALRRLCRPLPTYLTREASRELGEIVRKQKEEEERAKLAASLQRKFP